VVVDGKPLLPDAATPAAAGRYFYDAGTGELQVWAPGDADPSQASVGVLAVDEPGDQQAIYLDGASDVTVCGLTARFAGARGLVVLGDRVRVEHCKVQFNGRTGLRVAPYGGVASVAPEISENEIAWNFLRNWPRCAGGYLYAGWGSGIACESDGAVITGNVVHDNGGEGIVVGTSNEGATVHGNVVFDNFSANLYALNTQNVTLTGNLSYAHDPDLATLAAGLSQADAESCRKRLRPDGILTGDEGGVSSFAHALVANNVIVGTRHGIGHVNEGAGSGIKELTFAFNTIITPAAPLDFEVPVGISFPFDDGNNAGSVYWSNIVVGAEAKALLLDALTDPTGAVDAFHGIDIAHNLFFSKGNATPFHWGPDWDAVFDHAGWLAVAGAPHGAGDVVADPGLVKLGSFEAKGACPASAASPAVDQGADVGVTTDVLGRARPAGVGYDIGACEWGP
jgi:parallel beta-helix repeat protein